MRRLKHFRNQKVQPLAQHSLILSLQSTQKSRVAMEHQHSVRREERTWLLQRTTQRESSAMVGLLNRLEAVNLDGAVEAGVVSNEDKTAANLLFVQDVVRRNLDCALVGVSWSHGEPVRVSGWTVTRALSRRGDGLVTCDLRVVECAVSVSGVGRTVKHATTKAVRHLMERVDSIRTVWVRLTETYQAVMAHSSTREEAACQALDENSALVSVDEFTSQQAVHTIAISIAGMLVIHVTAPYDSDLAVVIAARKCRDIFDTIGRQID